jgi:predicted chitinase
VAVERAEHLFDAPLVLKREFAGTDWSVHRPTLKRAILENHFYELPLGRMLSNQTRSIIENQSGRFWECTPNENFVQAQQGLGPADCVQLLIYHELNQSVKTVAEQVAVSSYLINADIHRDKNPDIEAVISCYRDRSSKSAKKEQTFNLEQTGNMRALMTAWRRRARGGDQDALMAYVLGAAAFESNEFRTRRESLYYTSAERILHIWPHRFDDIPAAEQLSEIEKRYVRKPQDLAEKVYGGRNGNDAPGDGWLYRGRGLALVTYKESYRQRSADVDLPQLVDDPELIFVPEINARIFIEVYFPASKAPELQGLLTAEQWLDLRKMVLTSSGQRGSPDASAKIITEKTQMFDECIKNPKTGIRPG